ncbi:MAG: PKD domain-containing protein, partial [Thermoplasmata archaeon]|nr:PKD domain-containing protein [Thermoplasmata archaeon]
APFAHFGTNASYRANSTVSINATTSSDNAGITNFTWRLEGQAVCYGLYFTHSFAVPGEYVLNLTVSDAWGNSACFERTVYIVDQDAVLEDGNETGADDDAMTSVLLILLLIPIFIFLAILAVVIIKRR